MSCTSDLDECLWMCLYGGKWYMFIPPMWSFLLLFAIAKSACIYSINDVTQFWPISKPCSPSSRFIKKYLQMWRHDVLPLLQKRKI